VEQQLGQQKQGRAAECEDREAERYVVGGVRDR
jgi:hypothetical protein